ncbi:hypothetical protein C8N35_102388 [Breoghania corrubedonensis]|uniref:Uncharacterized protein n=2 Tax=Breoghania corrubedonensis TaxID=665038 RepID=A0A2T5VD45_9HYPH|nr:hypothetical protein C8N35_102388 [Breoghania corrubedonensis]
MIKLHSGSAFCIQELLEDERVETRSELEWLEKDLVQRRARLAYWARRKQDAETLPDVPEDLKQDTLYFYRRAVRYLQTGERLRAFLVAEIAGQPEHTSAYHMEQ